MKIQGTMSLLAAAAVAGLLTLGGCKSNSGNQPAAIVNGQPDNGNGSFDPAEANLAPVSNVSQPTQVMGQSSSYQPQQQAQTYSNGQQAPAPIVQGNSSQNEAYSYNAAPDNEQNYDAGQAAIYADQAPPPLPEYEQPPAPEPDYIWTPGYWNYTSAGYYWVPGAWCPPPYYGALWTPPFWAFFGGRYAFHRGYWGPHIGYYGGIDYGYGYVGHGYYGGYWGRDRHFYYNRAVTNVNVTNIHNVYNRTVIVNSVHYGPTIVNRVSYNGGRGGIEARPQPAELAAMREPHAPPVRAQVEVRTEAQNNRAQFYAQNHGRPAQAVFARPVLQNAHIAEPPAAAAAQIERSQQVREQNTQLQQRNAAEQQRNVQEHQRDVQQRRNAAVQQRPVEEQQRNAAAQQRTVQEQQHNQQLLQNTAKEQQRNAQPQQQRNVQEEQQRNVQAEQQRNAQAEQQRNVQAAQQRNAQAEQQRQAQAQQQRQVEQQRRVQQVHPQEQPRTEAVPRAQPAPAPRTEAAPRPEPAPRQEAEPRPQPAPREQAAPRPAPVPRAAPAPRTEPAAHPAEAQHGERPH